MRQHNIRPAVLIAAAAALCAPFAARCVDAQTPSPGITVSAAHVEGAEAVTISGNAPAGQPLEAALYATFSQDLPTVLVSRRPITTDANGHYTATIPTANAFFRNSVVTIVVQSKSAGVIARTSFIVGAPNVPAPPDAIPPSVR